MATLADYVYDRTIDYIENRANDNEIRHEYALYMSKGNWNNNEMGNLVDVTVIVAENELGRARNDREEEQIVRNAIVAVVDAHAGYVAMGDKQLVDSVDDRTYDSLRKAAANWEDILNAISGRGRGRGRDTGRRSVFDNDRGGVGARRNVFDRQEQRAGVSGGVFGSAPSQRASRIFDSAPEREESRAPARQTTFGASRPQARQPEPEPVRERAPVAAREPEVERHEGPDMSKDRPYDDFWANGEHWQLASRSSFVWTWSTKQQTRRAYDPEQEVRFLVKDKDGIIREEFIGMTSDLSEEAHVIRSQSRPNRPRHSTLREEADVLMPGEDIDAVDLDALENTYRCARKEFLGEVDSSNPIIETKGIGVSNIEDAILLASGTAAKYDNDVVSVSTIQGAQLASDKATAKAFDSIVSISPNEGDLLTLQKRLKSLRGVITENVMNYIDKHYTREVNDALRDQFGMTQVSIESFVEDFEDLLGCRAFQKQGAAYISQFLSRTRMIMAGIHYMTDEKERLEYLEMGDLLPIAEEDPENYRLFRECVVVLFKPRAMVHVKVDADQFGAVSSEMRVPLRTGEGADPVMADLLKNLYAIGRKTAGAGRVYLVTADNICLELVPASGARDIIGIRLADV